MSGALSMEDILMLRAKIKSTPGYASSFMLSRQDALRLTELALVGRATLAAIEGEVCDKTGCTAPVCVHNITEVMKNV